MREIECVNHRSRWYGLPVPGRTGDPQDPCAYCARKLVNGFSWDGLNQDVTSNNHAPAHDAGELKGGGATSRSGRSRRRGAALGGGVEHEGSANGLHQRSGRARSDAEGRARVGSACEHGSRGRQGSAGEHGSGSRRGQGSRGRSRHQSQSFGDRRSLSSERDGGQG